MSTDAGSPLEPGAPEPKEKLVLGDQQPDPVSDDPLEHIDPIISGHGEEN
ncbi:MAG: hypothetical protein M3P23_09320 [Actinomycetota bacterium]|nr:hypothetical protein [Actinomycetota bacterium]